MADANFWYELNGEQKGPILRPHLRTHGESQRAFDQPLRLTHGALGKRTIAFTGEHRELQIRHAAATPPLAFSNNPILVPTHEL